MRGQPVEDEYTRTKKWTSQAMYGSVQQVNKEISQLGKYSQMKGADIAAKQMIEDPSIYQYDEFVEEKHQQRGRQQETKQQDKSSRYMTGILTTLQQKRNDQNLIRERQLAKRSQQEQDEEVHVTEAYKKRMEEFKQFTQKEVAQDDYDASHAATKEEGLASIYRTLYATNQFAGGNRTNEPQLKAMLETEIQERKAQRDLVNHERILPRSRSREAERDRDHDREREERRLENERIDAELREEMRFKEQTAREEQLRTQKQVEQRQTKALSAKERYLQRQSQGTTDKADLEET